jgi:hypothetical protein
MNKYYLIEERGCNIEYVVFEGTLEECSIRKSEFLVNQRDEAYSDDLTSCEYRNGNLEPHTYRIVDVQKYDYDSHLN